MATTETNTKCSLTFTGTGNYSIPSTGTGAFDYETDSSGDAKDITVIHVASDGTETELTETTDYTISGSTFNVTNATLSTTSAKLILARETPNTQTYDFTENEPFPASQFTSALDRLTYMSQTQQEQLDRIIKQPISDTFSGSLTLPNATVRANTVLGFDATGAPIAAAGITAPVTTFMQTVLDDTDGGTALQTLGLTGFIMPYGGSSAPSGWLACDGSAVSRTTYSALFAAIGTTWGVGDGSTTFNVPDLRGAFLRGTGTHGSETMADSNAYAGPSTGSFEDDQMQKHRHQAELANGTEIDYTQSNAGVGASLGALMGNGGTNFFAGPFDSYDGGGTPRVGDETRPFNAGVLYCIKT